MIKLKPQHSHPPRSHRPQTKNWQYRQFSLRLCGIALTPVVLVGLINVIIDPYGIFKTPTYQKFNLLKPTQDDQTRLFKAVDIIQLKPRRIFLGSSRAILGLDPAHDALHDNLVTYNLGLTGPNIRDIREYFQHSLLNQPDLKQVVLALDFFMFKQPESKKRKSDNKILGERQIPLGELVRLTLSLDTLSSSQKTLENNLNSKVKEPYYFYGMRRDTYSSTQADKIKAFKHQIKNYFTSFYKDYQLSPESLQELEKIIALCKQNNIDLKVFISPIHATQMETIDQAGLWNDYEQWKREVSKITPFWDFATYNQVTTEPINNNMKNFHDSAHYTKSVGDLVLDKIYTYEIQKVPKDFGDLISPQNVESYLEKTRLDKQKWERENPAELKIVTDIHKQVK